MSAEQPEQPPKDAELGAGKTCFVICPIGDKLAPLGSKARLIYENSIFILDGVIEPACSRFGLSVVRADRITESGEIPEQVFTLLRDAEVVIADLSGGNANVMYELGLRHTRPGMITIPIGEYEQLPFDVTTIRTIKFHRTEASLIEARNRLIEHLRSSLEGKGTPASATRVWNENAGMTSDQFELAVQQSAIQDYDEYDEDDSGPGQLEIMAEGETALGEVGEKLELFSDELNSITAIMTELTPELDAAETFAAKLTIIHQMTEKSRPAADRMAKVASEYLAKVESISPMIEVIAGMIKNEEVQDPEEAEDLTASIVDLSRNATETSVQFTETLSLINEMPKWSTTMKPLAKTMRGAVSTVLRGNSIVSSWGPLLSSAWSEGGQETAE